MSFLPKESRTGNSMKSRTTHKLSLHYGQEESEKNEV